MIDRPEKLRLEEALLDAFPRFLGAMNIIARERKVRKYKYDSREFPAKLFT